MTGRRELTLTRNAIGSKQISHFEARKTPLLYVGFSSTKTMIMTTTASAAMTAMVIMVVVVVVWW